MLLIVENIVDILRKVGIRIVRFVVETMFENCFVGVLDTESQRMLQPLRTWLRPDAKKPRLAGLGCGGAGGSVGR